jgi:hypothetical protein
MTTGRDKSAAHGVRSDSLREGVATRLAVQFWSSFVNSVQTKGCPENKQREMASFNSRRVVYLFTNNA